MNIPLRAGRLLADADNKETAPLRFVINEKMAKTMFSGENPVGRRIVVQMKAENLPGEIIGVAGDTKHGGLDVTVRPLVYYPQAHLFFNFGTLVVQTSGDPASLSRPVTALIHEMDPELAVAEMGTMQRWIDQSVARPKFQSRLLAVIGIYSVVAYSVAQRRHEIGARMALGAQRGDVARMVLGRGARLALIGLGLGTLGSMALGRYLETLLFEVKAADPGIFAAMAGVLLAVTLAASYLPARRAAAVEPLEALRYE